MNSNENSSIVNVRDYGASPDASAQENKEAFQSAINHCLDNPLTLLYVPGGEYLVGPGLEVMVTKDSNYNGAFTMIGDPCEAQRNTRLPSRIVFDDHNTTNSKVGLSSIWRDDLENFQPVVFKLQYLQFSTETLRLGSHSDNFIGLHIPGGSLDISDCLFMGFSECALQVFDLGYAHIENTAFRLNTVGLRHSLKKWQAGTTATFSRCMGWNNGTVFEVPGLNHSTWEYCIFEYNNYGVTEFQRKCLFYKNYAENNRIQAIKPWNDIYSNALIIDNYSHKLPFDAFYCKKGIYLSTTGMPVGAQALVTSLISDNSGKAEAKIVGFTVHNNVIQNALDSIPKGWKFQHESEGTYTLEFGVGIRPLHFHVQPLDPSGNAMNHFTAYVVGLGDNYPKYGTASGIRIETFEVTGLQGAQAGEERVTKHIKRDSDLVITIIVPVDW